MSYIIYHIFGIHIYHIYTYIIQYAYTYTHNYLSLVELFPLMQVIPCQRWILKELSQRHPSLEDKASCSALPKTTPFHRNRTHKLVILWGNGSLRFSCSCWTYQHNVQHMQCGRTIPILPCFSNSKVFSCLLPVEIGQSPSARDLQHGCCANLEGRDVACGGWWWNVASSRHYERGSMERARKERAPLHFVQT